jgi:hypothetical protein
MGKLKKLLMVTAHKWQCQESMGGLSDHNIHVQQYKKHSLDMLENYRYDGCRKGDD